MADKVYLHIGLPKTATTYLQTVLWGARDQLRDEGLLLPGGERRDHLWASRVIRSEDGLDRMPARHATSWDRIKAEIAAWPGRALVTHEFFAAASAEQARRMIDELAPAEVHLVCTAREPLGLFTASWQESLKNRETSRMPDYSRTVSDSPRAIWNWRTLDLRLVLERWAPDGDGDLPADRVHVLPLPGRSAPREEIWHRFAGLLGLDSQAYDLSSNFPNESMGVVEAETLRRVNEHLGTFTEAIDKGVYIRTFLAEERLVPRGGERYWPDDAQVEECRERGRATVDHIRERGFDVIGDVDDLLVPEQLGERRHPDSVTEAEVAGVAVELVATLLSDVRDLRHERRALRNQLEARVAEGAAARPLWRIAGGRVRRALRGSRRA